MKNQETDTSDYVLPAQDPSRFFAPPSQPVRATFGARSDVGRLRPINEDHFLIIRRTRSQEVLLGNVSLDGLPTDPDEAFLLVLADGMGGAAFGEVASGLALRLIWELGSRATKWVMKLNESEHPEVQQRITAFAQMVHRVLLERGRANPEWAGMGTTLTAAYTMGSDAVIAHIGDSRAYSFREGSLQQLTQDHTLAEELIISGVPPEEAAPYRNVLTRCFGGPEVESGEIQQLQFRLQHGDRLLLCTDGLTDLVSNDEIAERLVAHPQPQSACDALVDLALDRGGKDNVTVVVAAYEIAGDSA